MPEPASRPAAVGRVLLVIVAAITVVAPMLLDGVVLAEIGRASCRDRV